MIFKVRHVRESTITKRIFWMKNVIENKDEILRNQVSQLRLLHTSTKSLVFRQVLLRPEKRVLYNLRFLRKECWDLLEFLLSRGFYKVPFSNPIVTSLISVLELRDLVCPR